jgi:hypothetical protein
MGMFVLSHMPKGYSSSWRLAFVRTSSNTNSLKLKNHDKLANQLISYQSFSHFIVCISNKLPFSMRVHKLYTVNKENERAIFLSLTAERINCY